MHNINEQLFLFFHGAVGQSSYLDQFMLFVTYFFVPVMMFTTAFWFLAVLPRTMKSPKERLARYIDAGMFIFTLAITWSLVELIKGLVGFPRPAPSSALVSHIGYDSFPSLHTALAFAVAIFVYRYSKSTGIFLIFFAILVGVSRIFVGVHYPLDVIVGAFIGGSIGGIIAYISKRFLG